ncbi:hypothetical protein [Nocardia sp. CDC160]|uniref:hypothetical protein n=1 Tax=Nocardia sp. CDC160 TaxID=3112166 RepID=UPI002DBAF8BA|nr:hypothetical protein [Nocardia sp. CDC160]MEC3915296.1 hypothetical protein [Nocardia sp. CDC160]
MSRVVTLVALWAVPPALIGLYWLFWAWIAPGFGYQNGLRAWYFNVVQHGSGPWWLLAYVFAITALAVAAWNEPTHRVRWTAVPLLLLIVSIAMIARFAIGLDKDVGRFYAGATTLYVHDPSQVPASLHLLTDGGDKNTDGCAIKGRHDVRGCVRQGDLPAAGWEPRVGSLDGARIALTRATGAQQAVSLRTETITYLNGKGDAPGAWSGVLDGSGINVPLGGVAMWSGQGNATQCTFTGDYGIDRAFGGARRNSLKNLLRERFPLIGYDPSDVWGYCDGKEPIVVVPVTMPMAWTHGTVTAPAGVITVRGDHGHVELDYLTDVTAGTLPGPVYPKSLTAYQREQTKWVAGRENMNRNHFGFDPATSEAQTGNVSEYLLRDKTTGRLQWVTPMTLRGSTSELFVAYSVTPADEVHRANLNQQSVYALDDTDRRRINIDNLDADARSWLATNAGTVMSNGGKLVEFTPVDGDVWRGFVEFNGRVAYRLDISASRSVPTQLVKLEDTVPGTQPQGPANADCGKDIASLTPAQLAQCAKVFVDELANRQAQQGPH